MAGDEAGSSAVVVDDNGRLRVLDLETNSHSRLVAKSCDVFQCKLQDFQNLVKQLLDQANEKAQQIEDAKLSAVGMRNMVSAEIETRPEKLRDQARLIADKQEQLERLNAEYESLLTVKQEQEALIARLSGSSLQV
ncbi:uncharacterized protein [Physcomitrium patens]|uniref:Intraflagellar transport protein 20 n=1 Tax=Physcomitrium patens TaxID=3218 RepID=A0A2K1IM65_PHYPA|nr:uncharacterized protein LOC112274916 [Physcomitrium patens]PNR30372.1 hypothetical protein PHYPA_026688 [Physcomitrium patens]|eukprot:XP_024360540.1 uncharacterized protein LOC112274916 [Physcomitrella patens]